MAEHFGITFQHHDALEDAETCAKIASRLKIPEIFICRFEYLTIVVHHVGVSIHAPEWGATTNCKNQIFISPILNFSI